MSDKTKEELLEEARERELEGRSYMNKDELENALANLENEGGNGGGDGSVSEGEGGDEVRDAEDLLTPTGQDEDGDGDGKSEGAEERLDAVEETSPVAADLAADEQDAYGPLHVEDPRSRVMTGAVNEEQAKEQERLTADRPDDFVGDVTEAGFDSDGSVVTTRRAAREYRSGYDNIADGSYTDPTGSFEVYNDRRDQVLGAKPEEDSSEESTSDDA